MLICNKSVADLRGDMGDISLPPPPWPQKLNLVLQIQQNKDYIPIHVMYEKMFYITPYEKILDLPLQYIILISNDNNTSVTPNGMFPTYNRLAWRVIVDPTTGTAV